ncbi:Eco57I restriction-modification methylase domain-containing protein [Halorubrum tibetense]|uniref:site-specific DNA-methyltransferase (adenine-specific) n=1 Tax=Halorubrum tibetense TaxID=175631 RepID=A0ABD5S694_9EURY
MQSSLTYRTNRDLFSNYYLDEHLPETEEWDEVDDDELEAAYDEIVDLYEREKSTAPKRNESQLEEKFIRPMFRKLGIPFEVEESTSRTQRRPDYGFFETEDAARDAFERREGGEDFYENAVAVADAKRWGRPLDTRGSGEHERDFENPSYQIHVYLQETPARWAVLTDGKKWRLYYGPTSHRLDSYYEVDLPTVLEKGDLEDFKYFYLFFRHSAFLEDAGGDCFLDDVYGESNVFAQELGEDLQDNIYEAIKILSEGYLQYPDNDLDEEDLDLIHDSSLIYLYRLIFVLYAEAEGRELLDTSNDIYEESYSLNSLKQEIGEELDSGDPKYRGWQNNLQTRLDELFMLIDQGSKSRGIPEGDLYIPAYNGGLFRTDPDEDDSPEARFLANHDVGDAYLAKVVELLTRSQNSNGGGKIFVDYSSLDVRHLGSIYEGLLEYQLNVADEPLSLDSGEYVSVDEGDDVVVQDGEVYLTTGSGERKATGSYYTPEYVVEYIVENTLKPLIDDIRADLAGRSARGDDRGFAAEFAERIFNLKILDPAMGSGHFLTSTIDYLAREIIDAQEKQAAQQGIETVDKKHDINWARRQVAQRCIYGVDLNPLAVELAKVSLWLRTLAAEQPLAFLDHHLKTGNSLVGSDIEEIEELESESGGDEKNASLADFGVARKGTIEQLMRIYQDFIAIENQELADVKEMESKYDEFERNKLRQRLEAMANVHTAEEFGLNNLPSDAYERMAAAMEDDDEWERIEQIQWFQDAQAWAEDTKYFHWKIEFPEVFYEETGSQSPNPGFDAVIGNPPYGRSVTTGYRDYLDRQYRVSEGDYDSYKFFLESTIEVIRQTGNLGLIIPNTFLTNSFFKKTRKHLLENTNLRDVVDLSDAEVFPEVTINTLIYICERSEDIVQSEYSIHQYDSGSKEIKHLHDITNNSTRLSVESFDLFTSESSQSIVDKMDDSKRKLGELMEFRTGLVTGDDEKFMVQEKRDENHKKLLFERDTSRYGLTWGGSWVNYDVDLMKSYSDAGRPREQWIFEVDEKILVQLLTYGMKRRINAVLDTNQYYVQKNLVILIPESGSIEVGTALAIINSKLMDWYYRQNYQDRAVKQTHLKSLPIVSSNVLSSSISDYLDRKSLDWIQDRSIDPTDSVEDVLSELSSKMMSLGSERKQLNTHLPDYLGDYSFGVQLAEFSGSQPAPRVSDSIISSTSDDYENLRVGTGMIERENGKLILKVTARYKPENENEYETDQWGYTETEPIPVIEFVGLSERQEALVEQFVPYAIDEAGGFANFRETATKNNSLYDRVSSLSLPEISDVEQGLSQYIDIWEKARELESELTTADEIIDQVVYDMYELTDEEKKIVESEYDSSGLIGH